MSWKIISEQKKNNKKLTHGKKIGYKIQARNEISLHKGEENAIIESNINDVFVLNFLYHSKESWVSL